MFRFLPLILLTSCVTTQTPVPEDTRFNEDKRDWIETYRYELAVAMENDDLEALKFFMQELIKEKQRQRNN